jgi:hypothetical protein
MLGIDAGIKTNIGEEIYVIGPEERTKAWYFSRGTAEGIMRDVKHGDHVIARIDVAPGYAGAPVINQREQVVGIVAMRDQSKSMAYLQGTDQIDRFLESYLPKGDAT